MLPVRATVRHGGSRPAGDQGAGMTWSQGRLTAAQAAEQRRKAREALRFRVRLHLESGHGFETASQRALDDMARQRREER
jgi:hypothetical protein